MLILTHNYPSGPKDNAGIWLKRAFDGFPVMKISKLGITPGNLARLRRGKGLILACWTLPAGLLAYLSGRPYILYTIGLDVFWIKRWRIIAWLFRPILDKACMLVFVSRHGHDTLNARYGERYRAKSKVMLLPVSAEEFHPG